MTNAKRNEAIQALIKDHTEKHTVSKAAARKALIEEGIYTPEGELRVEFGGAPKKSKHTA